MIEVYPNFIAPLFNTFKELPEEGELRARIDKMAAKLNFPLKKVYIMDGSTRSSHSNAYQYGFGSNKRIVIYDTLIKGQGGNENDASKGQSIPEVMAILWHELGHWWHGHIYQMMGF